MDTGCSVAPGRRKAVVAKLSQKEEGTKKNGEKFGKYLLKQGKSRIYALAYDNTNEIVKNILKVDESIYFPPETFSCKPRQMKWKSNSTCKYDMTFLPASKFMKDAKRIASTSTTSENADSDTSSIRKVSELLRTSQPFSRKLKSIKFNCGAVYRYLGCRVCNTSIPRKHEDGKYYCKGYCSLKERRKSKDGIASERKVCFTIYNVKLSDDKDDTIESAAIYNSVCELLFGKCGQNFDTDNEAIQAWEELITNNLFDITLKRDKKKKGVSYPAAVYMGEISKTGITPLPTRTVSESEFSYDMEDSFLGKKKKQPVPDFPKYEMKLQYTKEKYKDSAAKYAITSKPPGLVLLINNFTFPHRKEKERNGSEIDIDVLERGFRVMRYEIFRDQCHKDIKTRKEFVGLRDDFKAELCIRNLDSFFIVISSHGVNNEIELTGGESVSVVEELMIPFSDKGLPKYQGKPKVFMPITCQNFGKSGSSKSLEFLDNQLFDMLVCCPSFPGYAQTRYHKSGSFFVSCLMNNMMKFATSWCLVDILKKVQDDFKQQIKEKGLLLTVPHYIGSTFGKFVLVPQTVSKNHHDGNQFMEID